MATEDELEIQKLLQEMPENLSGGGDTDALLGGLDFDLDLDSGSLNPGSPARPPPAADDSSIDGELNELLGIHDDNTPQPPTDDDSMSGLLGLGPGSESANEELSQVKAALDETPPAIELNPPLSDTPAKEEVTEDRTEDTLQKGSATLQTVEPSPSLTQDVAPSTQVSQPRDETSPPPNKTSVSSPKETSVPPKETNALSPKETSLSLKETSVPSPKEANVPPKETSVPSLKETSSPLKETSVPSPKKSSVPSPKETSVAPKGQTEGAFRGSLAKSGSKEKVKASPPSPGEAESEGLTQKEESDAPPKEPAKAEQSLPAEDEPPPEHAVEEEDDEDEVPEAATAPQTARGSSASGLILPPSSQSFREFLLRNNASNGRHVDPGRLPRRPATQIRAVHRSQLVQKPSPPPLRVKVTAENERLVQNSLARATRPVPKKVIYTLDLSSQTTTLARTRTERIIRTVIDPDQSMDADEFAGAMRRLGILGRLLDAVNQSTGGDPQAAFVLIRDAVFSRETDWPSAQLRQVVKGVIMGWREGRVKWSRAPKSRKK